MALKCDNCGGTLSYRVKTSDLFCPHCKSTFNLKDFDISKVKTNDYICSSCGAGAMIIEGEAKLDRCPYCGSKSYVEGTPKTKYTCKGIVPFKIDKETAFEIARQSLIQENALPEFISAFESSKADSMFIPYSYQDRFFVEKDLFVENEYHNRNTKHNSLFSNKFVKEVLDEIAPFSEQSIEPFNPIYLDNSIAYLITQQFVDSFCKTRKPEYYLVPIWVFEIPQHNIP